MTGAYTVRPEAIIRQPALTMPGNATGSEAACTALTASQIRTLLSLGTADSPSFSGMTLSGDLLFNATNQYDIGNGTYDPRTVRAATSVLTPLLSTASGPLTLSSTSGMIGIGGTTSSFPALKRNANELLCRLGDDSAAATFKAKELHTSSGYITTFAGAYAALGSLNTGYPTIIFGNGSGVALRVMDGAGTYTVDIKPVGSNSIGGVFTGQGTSNPASGALATWQCAAVDNPGAALTLGNSTYGVTVPGAMTVGGASGTRGKLHFKQAASAYTDGLAVEAPSNDSFLSMRYDASDVFMIEPTYQSTGAYKGLTLRTSESNTLVLSVGGSVGVGAAPSIGRLQVKQIGSAFYSGFAVTAVANDSSLAMWHNGSKFIIEPTYSLTGSFQELAFRTSDTERLTISTAGAATFSGDISMSKTSAQGYIRAYNTAGTGNAWFAYLSSTEVQIGSTNNGAIRLETASAQIFRSGSSCDLRVYDSTVAKYSALTHDGTNGILSTSSGNLNLVPTGGTVAVTGAGTYTGGVTALTGHFGAGNLYSANKPVFIEATGADTGANYAGLEIRATASSQWGPAIYLNGSAQTSGKMWAIYVAGGLDGGTVGSLSFADTSYGNVLSITPSRVMTLDGSFVCAGITASGNVSYAQGLSTGTVTKSANYTTTADDYCVNVTANSIDITFETAVGCANREHEVINSGSGTVTLKTTSAQTISGSASGALTLAQWKSIRVKSDGANWLIMSQIT